MGLPRYDLEAHSNGTAETFRWKGMGFVRYLIEIMGPGDDLVIHRTENDAVPGTEYGEG